MKQIWQSFLLLGWLILLLAIAYPFLLTLFAQMTWENSARGSLIIHEDKVRGSAYVAQKFTQDRYFWPRPSASNYATLPSRSPVYPLLGAELQKRVQARTEQMMKSHGITDPSMVPSGILFDSASGIDPDIMLPSALFQVERVAKARGMNSVEGRNRIMELVFQAKVKKPLNLFGRECVNVLLLNQSLDALSATHQKEAP